MSLLSYSLFTSDTYSTLEVNEKKFSFFPNDMEITDGSFTLDMEGHTLILLGNVTVSNDIKIRATALFALNALFKAPKGNFDCVVTEKGYFLESGIEAKNAQIDGTKHLPSPIDRILPIKNIFRSALKERNGEVLIKNLLNVVNLIKLENQDQAEEGSKMLDSLKFLGIPYV